MAEIKKKKGNIYRNTRYLIKIKTDKPIRTCGLNVSNIRRLNGNENNERWWANSSRPLIVERALEKKKKDKNTKE